MFFALSLMLFALMFTSCSTEDTIVPAKTTQLSNARVAEDTNPLPVPGGQIIVAVATKPKPITIGIKCITYGANQSYHGYGTGNDGNMYEFTSTVSFNPNTGFVRKTVATQVAYFPASC